MPFLVTFSQNTRSCPLLPHYAFMLFYFSNLFTLSPFTRRPHWCHLPFNVEQLEVSGIEYILEKAQWMGGGCPAGQMNKEWLGEALT